MAISRTTAKTYFETGDIPTQSQFVDTLDSIPFYDDATFTDLPGTTWDGSYKTKTLTANTALTFSSSKKSGVLIITQDGTGSRTLSINGTAATINTAAGSKTLITFIYNEVTSSYVFTIETNVIGNITGGDVTAPVRVSATIENANPSKIIITYNEALDTASVPSTGNHNVTIDSIGGSLSSVAVVGSTEELTLSAPVTAGQVVVIGYSPGTNPIQDLAGNDAAGYSGVSVTNNVGSSFDSDAQAFFTYIEGTVGATLTSGEKTAVDNLVTARKSAGLWSKDVLIYPNVGSTLAARAVNLKTPGTNTRTFTGGTLDTDGVAYAGGTDWADSGLDVTTLTNYSTGKYGATYHTQAAVQNCMVGVPTGTLFQLYQSDGSTPTAYPNIGAGSAGISYTGGLVGGLNTLQRNPSDVLEYWQGATLKGTDATAGGNLGPAGNIWFHKYGGTINADAAIESIMIIHEGFTAGEMVNNASSVNTFLTALSR